MTVLLVGFGALRFIAGVGYGRERVDLPENIHYLTNVVLLVLFSYDLLSKMLSTLKGGGRK
jgi:hypothetical protein